MMLMEPLEQCPCGELPTKLHITTTSQGRRWATVSGDCCDIWTIDFYSAGLSPPEVEKAANNVWNTAPRNLKRKEGK